MIILKKTKLSLRHVAAKKGTWRSHIPYSFISYLFLMHTWETKVNMKLNWGSRSCIIYLQMSWRAAEASIKWWRSGSIFLEFLQDHQGNWNHPTKFKRVLGFIDSLISPHRVTHSRTLGARGFSCPVSESLSRGFAARVFSVLAAAADEAPRRTRKKTSSTQGTTVGNWAYRFQ